MNIQRTSSLRWASLLWVLCLLLAGCESYDERVDLSSQTPLEVGLLSQIQKHRQSKGLTAFGEDREVYVQSKRYAIRLSQDEELFYQLTADPEVSRPYFEAVRAATGANAVTGCATFNGDMDAAGTALRVLLSTPSCRQLIESREFTLCGVGAFQGRSGAYFFSLVFAKV